jgi:hypothetical protein
MNIFTARCATPAGAIVFAVLLSGCVVGGGYGGGYDGDVGVGVGVDYYEPAGVVYGGWGPGYHVGPYRGGERGRDVGHARGGGSHAYRAAPASHSIPSIPSGSRSSGNRR